MAVPLQEDFAAFDALPAPLRRMIGESPIPIAAVTVYDHWQARGVLETLDAIVRLEQLALAELAHRDAQDEAVRLAKPDTFATGIHKAISRIR